MTKQSSPKRTHSSDEVAHVVSLFFAVRRIMRTTLAKDKNLDPSTWLRIETMKFIADHDKPKMKDLADHLFITAPSATSLVGGLMKGGLVAIYIDQHDRRTSRLKLTTKGKTELKKTITRSIKMLGGLFATLSEAELAAFVGALERIKRTAAE